MRTFVDVFWCDQLLLLSQEDEEDGVAFPTQQRNTLWESWGARQGWIKGIKAVSTVATLALGLLALVETAYMFGVGKVSEFCSSAVFFWLFRGVLFFSFLITMRAMLLMMMLRIGVFDTRCEKRLSDRRVGRKWPSRELPVPRWIQKVFRHTSSTGEAVQRTLFLLRTVQKTTTRQAESVLPSGWFAESAVSTTTSRTTLSRTAAPSASEQPSRPPTPFDERRHTLSLETRRHSENNYKILCRPVAPTKLT